jgi:hypothetical protein
VHKATDKRRQEKRRGCTEQAQVIGKGKQVGKRRGKGRKKRDMAYRDTMKKWKMGGAQLSRVRSRLPRRLQG